ncbi:recombinase family protein [Nocardia fluminea]|uniref:recombinase family protein n=1 Tax=Nocardia fluminea TaxID=134984 RepID=UPI00365EDC12
MQEVRRFKPSTVAPDSGCNRLLPHLCHRRCPGALTGRVHAAPASLERVTDVGAFAPAVRSTAERGTGLGQSVRLRARCLFTDRKSGKDTERAELWKCLEYMRAGDTLVVPSLDRLGRPPAMTEEQIRQARAILNRPEETVSSVARLLGVSRSTIYKYVPELAATGHASVDSSAISITT